MSKELTTTNENQVQVVDDNMLKDYLKAFGLANKLNDNEITQFIEVAKAFQLNPFKREIYCVPYGYGDKKKLSIITGYESYIKRAEESGKLTGWSIYTVGEIPKMKAIIEIYRNDWKEPFKHEVEYNEYVQMTNEYIDKRATGKKIPNAMWGGKPKTMLKKVAIAQGFRLAFPCSVGGMPYTNDELPTEMTQEKVVEPVVIPKKKVEKKAAPKQEGKQKGNLETFKKHISKAQNQDDISTIQNLIPRREWTKEELEVIKFEINAKELEFNKPQENDDISFEDI